MHKLKAKRLAEGYSVRDLARRLNVTDMTIYNYESGKRFPKIEILRKLAVIFNCTIDELVGSEKETV